MNTFEDRTLELYLDDALDARQARALEDALARDPALRRRLALLRRGDDLARRALTLEHPAPAPGRINLRRLLPTLAAAGLAMATGVALVRTGHAPPAIPPVTAPAQPVVSVGPPSPGVRVLLEIPLRGPAPLARQKAPTAPVATTPDAIAGVPAAAPDAAPAAAPGSIRDLERALEAGDAAGAARLLASMPEPDRARAEGVISRTLRSARTAELLLDELGPEAQVTLASRWALEPELRPVAFDRLRRLAGEEATSALVETELARLSRLRDLGAWVRGFQPPPAPGEPARRPLIRS